MPTIAEPASPHVLLNFRDGVRQLGIREMSQHEFLESGRVNNPAAIVQLKCLGERGGVPARSEGFRDGLGC